MYASLFLFFLVACKKDEEQKTSIDQAALLENMLQQVILPAYQDYSNSLQAFDKSWSAFKTNQTKAQLGAVQKDFKQAYLNWTHCEPFDFGPAMEQSLYSYTAVFPAKPELIEKHIGAKDLNVLDQETNATARGFSALDYLLYGKKSGEDVYQKATPSEVVGTFKADKVRRDYVDGVLQRMKSRIEKVESLWKGDYGKKFLSTLGVAKESSISNLANFFSKTYELTKNARIRFPLTDGIGKSHPELLEARFSGISKDLIVESIKAAQNIYLGRSKSGKDGLGFHDWLEKIGGTKKVDGKEQGIAEALNAQLKTALEACQAIPQDMEAALSSGTQKDKIQTANLEVSKAVVLIKVDMTSLIGVQIVYADNDGD